MCTLTFIVLTFNKNRFLSLLLISADLMPLEVCVPIAPNLQFHQMVISLKTSN